MEDFTHGIMAIDPDDVDENDNAAIVHFIGLWQAPTEEVFEQYEMEIKTDPEFGLVEIADRLVILPAPYDIVKMFNDTVQEHEKSKLN